MYQFILTREEDSVGIITLNRPQILNAWHRPMRNELMDALTNYENDANIRAIILTGAGHRAFCAGQDLHEAQTFDPDGAEGWIEEWRTVYGLIRSLTKPLVVALNGLAAGSGFQAALLADIRIGHPGVSMGQPEINSGIASITGPWIMKEILGLSRTIELTLTGRMMEASECNQIGIIHRLVPAGDVLKEALAAAHDLAAKPQVAMRINKRRFKEMTEAGFQEALDAAVRFHRESYASGEPHHIMQKFFDERATRRGT